MQRPREILGMASNDKDAAAFLSTLFYGFSYSISASLSLVILSSHYDLACCMVESLAETSLMCSMAGTVVELSHLVLLFESPAFASTRLRLLDVSKYPALLR